MGTAPAFSRACPYASCKSAFKVASKLATGQDDEVRKMFKRNMEEEAAKGKPELSKKAHKAFKNITGTVSRDDGLGGISTWTTPEGTQVARGHDEVGKMVSAYTHI